MPIQTPCIYVYIYNLCVHTHNSIYISVTLRATGSTFSGLDFSYSTRRRSKCSCSRSSSVRVGGTASLCVGVVCVCVVISFHLVGWICVGGRDQGISPCRYTRPRHTPNTQSNHNNPHSITHFSSFCPSRMARRSRAICRAWLNPGCSVGSIERAPCSFTVRSHVSYCCAGVQVLCSGDVGDLVVSTDQTHKH